MPNMLADGHAWSRCEVPKQYASEKPMLVLVMALLVWPVLGWLLAVFHGLPEMTRTMGEIAALFVVLDTVSGVVVAAKSRRLTSKRIRDSLISKLTQYTLFLGLATGIKLAISTWFPIQWAFGAIAMIECVSILENIKRLDRLGGVQFGPARPALRWMAQFFEQGIGDDRPREAETDEVTTKEIPK